MSLLLDARQRAMLAEMGIRVWQPLPEPPSVTRQAEAAAARTVPAQAPAPPVVPSTVRPMPAPATAYSPAADAAARPSAQLMAPALPPSQPEPAERATAVAPPASSSAAGPATGHWPAWEALDAARLQQAVADCEACALHTGRHHAVWDARAAGLLAPPAPGAARWMVVLDAPGEAEDVAGLAAAGDPGRLLDHMIAALRLDSAQVYRTHVTKCAVPAARNVTGDEIASCAGCLRREILLVQPTVVVALGRHAVQGLLGRSEPLGTLRGQVYHVAVPPQEAVPDWLAELPVIVSYPLAHLMRHASAKAQAWQDLCLAYAVQRSA